MLKIPFQLTLKLQNHVVTQGCLYVMMIWIDALGIIHVKYAFRELNDNSNRFDLRKITKAPARLSREEPLPVALKRMMKLKVHMALVRDEFGRNRRGKITRQDILEEVVGEIQDEFDADEKPIEEIGENKWRVSGLVPVHDNPS